MEFTVRSSEYLTEVSYAESVTNLVQDNGFNVIVGVDIPGEIIVHVNFPEGHYLRGSGPDKSESDPEDGIACARSSECIEERSR